MYHTEMIKKEGEQPSVTEIGCHFKINKIVCVSTKPKNNGAVFLKFQPFCAKIVDECLWPNMHWVGVKFLSFFLCYEIYFVISRGT